MSDDLLQLREDAENEYCNAKAKRMLLQAEITALYEVIELKTIKLKNLSEDYWATRTKYMELCGLDTKE